MTEVSVRDVSARPIAGVRGDVAPGTLSTRIIALLDQVYAVLKEQPDVQRGQNVVMYDGLATIIAGVEVGPGFVPTGSVILMATPAGSAATVTHVGPYAEMARTNDVIVGWCRAEGLQLAGVSWEVYGDWVEDERALTTDVYYLLKP